MSFQVPDDRRYLDSHEWAAREDGLVRIGITDFAQDELGDVVFVELTDEGEELTAGESFGVVESIKAVSDVYVPVGGTVRAVNEELETAPELVNESPYEEGWMIAIEEGDEAAFEDLLSAEAYADQIA
jgi:glycine cleavage system H protein